jgi:hypothetical protein
MDIRLIAIVALATFSLVTAIQLAAKPPPALRPCTFTAGGAKVSGVLHEQKNGKFCIPYAD